ADAATVTTANWYQLLHPRTWKATRETSKRGYHVARAGKRVRQLGATFVIAPGDIVRYEHVDRDSTDHAPVIDVLAALTRRSRVATPRAARGAARAAPARRSGPAAARCRRGDAGPRCATRPVPLRGGARRARTQRGCRRGWRASRTGPRPPGAHADRAASS